MGQIHDEYGCPRKKHAGWLLSRSWELDDVRVETMYSCQGLSQELETGCLKLAIVKFLGVQFLRGTTLYSDFNHKQVYIYQNRA